MHRLAANETRLEIHGAARADEVVLQDAAGTVVSTTLQIDGVADLHKPLWALLDDIPEELVDELIAALEEEAARRGTPEEPKGPLQEVLEELGVGQSPRDAQWAMWGFAIGFAGNVALVKYKVGAKRFEVAYNRYVIGRIDMDNLYLAQNEKNQALSQYLQSLRGFWLSYYRLRRVTLYDFAAGAVIR